MLSVNTNISSLNAQRSLLSNSQGAAVAMERLASGKRINSAKDDAAGLAIASRLESQVKGVTQGIRNLSDATSVLQVAEGGMASIETNLQRMRELAVQASNGSYSDEDRSSLNNEATQLLAEIDRVASTTSFGGQSLLDGTFTSKNFNLGSSDQNIEISIRAAGSNSIGLDEHATVSLGNLQEITGSVSGDSTFGPRQISVSNSISGVHAVAWSPGVSNTGQYGKLQRFDGAGVEISSVLNLEYNLIDHLGGDQYIPEVTQLSDGSFAAVSVEAVHPGWANPPNGAFGYHINLHIFDSNGNRTAFLNVPNDHLYYNSLPHIIDLGGSEFLVTWSTGQYFSRFGLEGVVAQKFDYSGNEIGSEIALAGRTPQVWSGTTDLTGQFWMEEPVRYEANMLAAPIVNRGDNTTAQLEIRLIDSSTGATSKVISLDSVTSLYKNPDGILHGISHVDGDIRSDWLGDTIRIVSGSNSISAIWRNDDDQKLYGQRFDFTGNALTTKVELASNVLSLNAINTTVLNNDYIDVLFAENSSGVNKALFQRFDAEFRGLIADPVEIFEAVGGRAELVTLSDGSIRAYESFEGGEPVGYRDFTVAHNHGFDLTSISSSSLSIAAVDRGLENLNVARSEVGAQMNRIESAMNTLQITKENSAAAKSRIVDADYAAETARLAKHQILQQASISVLAQANARPEMVLALLRDL